MSSQDNKINLYMYQYNAGMEEVKEDEKELLYIEKVNSFEQIQSIEEAKKRLKEVFPDFRREISHINIASTTFTIVNQGNLIRISYNSEKEFRSYSYSS